MKQWIPCLLLIGLISCGGSNNQSELPDDNPGVNPDLSGLKVFNEDSPYASILVDCLTIIDAQDSCQVNQLPPIGSINTIPTLEEIMDRVTVSHDWMGIRFRQLLTVMPFDVLVMFRATTGIVIHRDIRPAHYRSDTGAIYIDPSYLWLTLDEKATVSEHEDFRSNFGDELSFKRLWRYIINNDNAWQSTNLSGTEPRQISDILISSSWLLFHELAHANDCLPPSQIENLVDDLSFLENFQLIRDSRQCVHHQLVDQSPLNSDTWFGLAQVLYHGETASEEQKQLTPEQVGSDFAMDYAMDTYSYSTVWEDVAMTFEAVLMKKNFNADRDMVIVPFYDEFSCDAASIKWGQRGRLGDPTVISRGDLIVSKILPELDLANFYSQQPQPTQIIQDTSYCALDLNSSKTNFSKSQLEAAKQQTQLMELLH